MCVCVYTVLHNEVVKLTRMFETIKLSLLNILLIAQGLSEVHVFMGAQKALTDGIARNSSYI